MGKPYTPLVREEKRQAFLSYLESNPDVTIQEARDAGHNYALDQLYQHRLNQLKMKLGYDIAERSNRAHPCGPRETNVNISLKNEFDDWLSSNPEAEWEDVIAAGYRQVVKKFYNHRLNEARRLNGVPERPPCAHKIYTEADETRMRDDFLSWLRGHPDSVSKDIRKKAHVHVWKYHYKGRTDDAKKDAGVPTRSDRYIQRLNWNKEELDRLVSSDVNVSRDKIASSGLQFTLKQCYGNLGNAKRKIHGEDAYSMGMRPTSDLEKELLRFQRWLKRHPGCSTGQVSRAGYYNTLHNFYSDRPNDAKREIGITALNEAFIKRGKRRRTSMERDYHHIRFRAWLKSHPSLGRKDAVGAGFDSVIYRFYGGSFCRAQRASGLQSKGLYGYSDKEWEMKKEEYLEWLRQNPTASAADLRMGPRQNILIRFFQRNASDAWVAAGLPPDKDSRRQYEFEMGIEIHDDEKLDQLGSPTSNEMCVMDVRNAIGILNTKGRYVMEHRLYERETLEEIGRQLKLTRSRIQQIERDAMRKMASYLYDYSGQ